MEALWQLGIYAHFLGSIQILGETTFDTLVCGAIGEHVILNCLIRTECLIKALGILFGCENRTVISAFQLVIGDVFYNHSGEIPK